MRYAKKIKDALHILEEVIRKTDRCTDALLLKGLIMRDMDRFEHAAHCFSQATEIQPKDLRESIETARPTLEPNQPDEFVKYDVLAKRDQEATRMA